MKLQRPQFTREHPFCARPSPVSAALSNLLSGGKILGLLLLLGAANTTPLFSQASAAPPSPPPAGVEESPLDEGNAEDTGSEAEEETTLEIENNEAPDLGVDEDIDFIESQTELEEETIFEVRDYEIEIKKLLRLASKDIREAVEIGRLGGRVVLVHINSFETKIRNRDQAYLIKELEAIYLEESEFRLVKSIAAFSRSEVKKNRIVLKGFPSKEEIEEYARELETEFYAIVELYKEDDKLTFSLVIKEIKEHSNIWGESWSTIVVNKKIVYGIRLLQGLANGYPILISGLIGGKFLNYFSYGFFIEVGVSLTKLYPLPKFNFDTSSQIAVHGLVGGEFNFNLLSPFELNYYSFELYLISKFGPQVYFIANNLDPLTQISFNNTFLIAVGFSVIIKSSYELSAFFNATTFTPFIGVGFLF